MMNIDALLHHQTLTLVSIILYVLGHWTVAGVTAVCAIALSAYGQYATRRHHRLSVRPYLAGDVDWERENDVVKTVSLKVINQGLGPAFIKKFQIYHKGKPLSWQDNDDFEQQIKKFFPEGEIASSSILGNKSALTAQESKTILKIKVPKNDKKIKDIQEAFSDLNLHIKYKSMYGKSWHYNSSQWVPPLWLKNILKKAKA